MTKVASEDSVRRAMKAMDEGDSGRGLKKHLKASYEPLLQEPWVLDVDTTLKPLYGHQQDAKVGYNPTKPGRPSHAYHSYFVGNIRMVLDMEVQAGNQTAPLYAQPELWAFLDGLACRRWPERCYRHVSFTKRRRTIKVPVTATRHCPVSVRPRSAKTSFPGRGAAPLRFAAPSAWVQKSSWAGLRSASASARAAISLSPTCYDQPVDNRTEPRTPASGFAIS